MLYNIKCEYCCNLYDHISEYNFELHQTKSKSQHERQKQLIILLLILGMVNWILVK
jgi:hypothetical protein